MTLYFIMIVILFFTSHPNFDKFTKDKIWYLSNTVDYIGSKYILSKGEDIYLKMCDIIGIDKKFQKIMESNLGGFNTY